MFLIILNPGQVDKGPDLPHSSNFYTNVRTLILDIFNMHQLLYTEYSSMAPVFESTRAKTGHKFATMIAQLMQPPCIARQRCLIILFVLPVGILICQGSKYSCWYGGNIWKEGAT
ncbi:hypothetical protein TNCV_3513351 [Trichonephila clavipes]|nr:hypothetical protein TNCV_3513351 [Trichonephila clavipes]